MKTFFNYCGGKSRLVKTLKCYIPQTFATYYEPFLGSGALFLELASSGLLHNKTAILSDLDTLLMTAWRGIQQDGKAVIQKIQALPDTRESWQQQLTLLNDPTSQDLVSLACAYIFVKHRSFASILRCTQKGKLNPSYNHFPSPFRFQAMREGIPLLQQGVHLFGCSFSALHPKKGDFVFLDPPYWGTAAKIYRMEDGVYPGLVAYCHRLTQEGVHWMMTNTDCPDIRDAFSAYTLIPLGDKPTYFALNQAGKRPRYGEILVLSSTVNECQKGKNKNDRK